MLGPFSPSSFVLASASDVSKQLVILSSKVALSGPATNYLALSNKILVY